MVFVNQDSPVYMMGGFDVMAALLDNQPKVAGSIQVRQRRRLGRSGRLHVLRGRSFLQARIS